MSAPISPAIRDLIPILAYDVIETVSVRPNETEENRQVRARLTIRQIEAHAPEDEDDILLAAKIVLHHALAVDAARQSIRQPSTEAAHRDRQQVLALGRLQVSLIRERTRKHALRQKAAKEAEKAAREAGNARTAAPTAPAPAARAPDSGVSEARVPAAQGAGAPASRSPTSEVPVPGPQTPAARAPETPLPGLPGHRASAPPMREAQAALDGRAAQAQTAVRPEEPRQPGASHGPAGATTRAA